LVTKLEPTFTTTLLASRSTDELIFFVIVNFSPGR
jgi:hypothetical protein